MQETHSVTSDEEIWQKEWGNIIYFCHGTSASRGVAILVPHNFEIFVTDLKHDSEGRLLLLDCTIEGNSFILLNIYAPTKDKVEMQNVFLSYLHSVIENYSDKNIILGGDFNVCLNPVMDKHGGRSEVKSEYCKNLENIIEEFSLVDIWRLRNEKVMNFTRRERTKGGFVQSRIDYWFTSNCIQYVVKNTCIKPGYGSDHSILTLQIELLQTQKRGRGIWKFNNNLLNDSKYVEMVKQTISNVLQEVHFENKNLEWEYLKCQIRTDTMVYAGEKAKKQRTKEIDLQNRLEFLEQNLKK